MEDIKQDLIDACPICGGGTKKRLSRTLDTHYGNRGTWDWSECLECSVWFLNPMPTESFLYEECYDADAYYSFQPFYESASLKKRLLSTLGYHPEKTYDPDFRNAGCILDIGCGSGRKLFEYKQNGWEVCGIEPNEKAAEFGNANYGLNIYTTWEAAEEIRNESLLYIRSNHSFEHLLNPQKAILFIHRKLAENGRLFIGVPNSDSFPARIFGRYWWNLGAPLHPFGWNIKSLSSFLEKNGFVVESARTNSNFSGFLGSLQIYINRKLKKDSDNGFLFRNAILKLGFNVLAKFCDLVKAGDCLEVIARKK